MYIICAEKEVFDDIWGFPKNENNGTRSSTEN